MDEVELVAETVVDGVHELGEGVVFDEGWGFEDEMEVVVLETEADDLVAHALGHLGEDGEVAVFVRVGVTLPPGVPG